MDAILKAALGLVVIMSLLFGGLEFMRKRETQNRIGYLRIFVLTVALLVFAGSIFVVLNRLFPDRKAEGKIALSAFACWGPVCFMAYRMKKRPLTGKR